MRFLNICKARHFWRTCTSSSASQRNHFIFMGLSQSKITVWDVFFLHCSRWEQAARFVLKNVCSRGPVFTQKQTLFLISTQRKLNKDGEHKLVQRKAETRPVAFSGSIVTEHKASGPTFKWVWPKHESCTCFSETNCTTGAWETDKTIIIYLSILIYFNSTLGAGTMNHICNFLGIIHKTIYKLQKENIHLFRLIWFMIDI